MPTKKISYGFLIVMIWVFLFSNSEEVFSAPQALFSTNVSSTSRAVSTYRPTSSPPEFVITANDLSHAGFTSIEKLSPTESRFQEPVQYFRVSEQAPSSTLDCDGCANLVAIHITPVFATTSPAWILDQNPVISKVGSRIQYKWFIGFRILYITGPHEDLVIRLAKELRERIVLNKIDR